MIYMKKYYIDQELLQATISYLASKPYSEVSRLIQLLSMAPAVKIEDEPKGPSRPSPAQESKEK